jgi:hypothetical protein
MTTLNIEEATSADQTFYSGLWERIFGLGMIQEQTRGNLLEP